MTGAWLLILLGLALLLVEVVLPSGMLLVLSLAALATGVLLIFFAPPEEGGGTTTGFLALTLVLIVIPVILGAAFYYLPRNPIGKQLFLPDQPIEEVEAPMTDNVALEQLLGQIGKTATELRPSGVTLIQGHRVDTKTEGMYVDAGQWVRVTDVRGGQITVRPLSRDELRDLPDDLNA
jgi:membrane-bound serine protease (ClpP class)